MKKLLSLSVSVSLVAYMALTSCVPTRQLKSAQAHVDSLKRDSLYTHSQLDDCNLNVKNLQNEKKGLLNDKSGLINEKEGLLNEKKGLLIKQVLKIRMQTFRMIFIICQLPLQ
jgi:hypothetical protein